MIPILYENSEVAFATNGLGRLSEIVSCTVTEERNGIYELEFQYPISGKLYEQMATSGGIVACWHDDNHDLQPFDIYRRSAPINGIVTFYAHHISYRLSNVIATPFEATSCSDAVSKISSNCVPVTAFSFYTNKDVSSPFSLKAPRSVRDLLAGEEGSLLDVYGKSDYQFDMFTVRMLAHRGVDRGVQIRYGKNMTDITDDYDESGIFTAIAPYWIGGEETEEVVMLPEVFVTSQDAPQTVLPVAMDFSANFEEKPTVAQLRDAAVRYLDNNKPWIPERNITVSFNQYSSGSAEYDALQKVCLCDTVSVYYTALGVVEESKQVIRVVYDVLLERNKEVEFGDQKATLASTILNDVDSKLKDKASVSFLRDAVADATTQITGSDGGYIVIKMNSDNQPEEFLILDTQSIGTAVNVWRWNKNGLGHSHSGYDGPYDDIALTQDGKINANMITAGVLNGDLIRVRNLTVVDEDGNVLATYDASGITLGQTDDAHAELDFNTFMVKDKDGNVIFSVGDSREADGLADVVITQYEFWQTTPFINLVPNASSVDTIHVYLNGTEITPQGVSVSQVWWDEAPYPGSTDVIRIEYKTAEPFWYYTLGTRDTTDGSGYFSTTIGRNNKATGSSALSAGGYDNAAEGGSSATLGGGVNTARGGESVVVGGQQNEALADQSGVIGGMYASNDGARSIILGGEGLKTHGRGQLAFGEYNDSSRGSYVGTLPPPYVKTMLETVGNGTSDSNRSNARTLDWQGNEVLAGTLTIEGNRDVGAELDSFYYAAGDTEDITQSIILSGLVTSSRTQIVLDYHTEKSMKNISNITVTNLYGTIRGISGYVDNAQANQSWLSGFTVAAVKAADHVCRITIRKSAAMDNTTNNTPVVYWGFVGLSFS